MSKEHVIFQTTNFDERSTDEQRSDYINYLKEVDDMDEEEAKAEAKDDTKFYDWLEDGNGQWFEDEQMNLSSKETDEKIVVLISAGLWNGRRTGFKELNYDLRSLLGGHEIYKDCDYRKIYVDRYDVKGVGIHHDGTNYYTFRMWKAGVTDEQKERVENAFYWCKDNAESLFKRYTRSIKSVVKEIYGW